MNRLPLALLALCLVLPAFADDDDAPADEPAAESNAVHKDARGVGAKTKVAAPSTGTTGDDDDDAPVSRPAGNGPGTAVRSGAFEPVKTRKLQSGSGGGGAAAGGGALPPEIQGTKFEVYPNLKSMPRHAGAHGAASVTHDKQGYAVGFKTGAASEPGNVRGGQCAIGETPVVPHEDGCYWYAWISASPGGAPAGGTECTAFKLFPRVATVNWASIAKQDVVAKALFSHCQLKPSSTFYCNFTAVPFGGKDFPKECGGAIASPISVYD